MAAEAACPGCGQLSGRRHGGYPRRLRDVPAGGRPVVIWLAARRFRCLNPACPKVTFTEQAEGLASRFARRTPLLAGALAAVAAVLAGRAGARLAAALAMPAGRDSMIRLVMALPEEELAAAPQVLGVDDFALRKGHVYGTVLAGMEAGGVIGLLPDREAATLEKWLAGHPGAAVICRDWACAYADGARAGAPDAVQVADRWHLLHNLCEKTYQAAAAHRASCLGADERRDGQPELPRDGQQDHGQQEQQDQPGRPEERQDPQERAGEEEEPPARKPGLPERTRARHAEIHQLLDAGHPKTAVARILGLSAPTVAKYARAATPGEITAAAREQALDPYKPYLIARWNAGTHDARVLHAEITARGYAGCDQQVRRFVRPFRDLPGPAPEPPPAVPSARKITTWLMTSPGSSRRGRRHRPRRGHRRLPPPAAAPGRHPQLLRHDHRAHRPQRPRRLARRRRSQQPGPAPLLRPRHPQGPRRRPGRAVPALQQRQGRRHRLQDQDDQAPHLRTRQLRTPPQTRPPRLTSQSNHHEICGRTSYRDHEAAGAAAQSPRGRPQAPATTIPRHARAAATARAQIAGGTFSPAWRRPVAQPARLTRRHSGRGEPGLPAAAGRAANATGPAVMPGALPVPFTGTAPSP